jgi:thymidylate synthase
MNNIDKQYQDLLQDILDNGINKTDRTGTGTISVFGRQIKHNMKDGFPLLTTKKMAFKTMVTELLWFLRGDTNIKYLVDNDCHIWNGDCFSNYQKQMHKIMMNNIKYEKGFDTTVLNERTDGFWSYEEFINKIKTDDEFAKKWGELGSIYGKQWRNWEGFEQGYNTIYNEEFIGSDKTQLKDTKGIDQIQNLINDLKTNPDSRRLMVNSWNVGELDQMVLPPCHYGFQVYTRELSMSEKELWYKNNNVNPNSPWYPTFPTRAISLMYNARSQDVPLGTPFNIASYALLLEIIAKMVNMVPDELITNMGDCHIYSNQIDGIKEQIGRDYTLEERLNMVSEEIQKEFSSGIVNLPNFPNTPVWSDGGKMSCLDDFGVPRRTREPYPLPKLVHMKTDDFYKSLSNDLSLLTHLDNTDFVVENYQSHPSIKMPLSN